MADHWYHPDGTMESTDMRTAKKNGLFPSVTKILGLIGDDYSYWKEGRAIEAAVEHAQRTQRVLTPEDVRVIRGHLDSEWHAIRETGNLVHQAMDYAVKNEDLPPVGHMAHMPHACWWRSVDAVGNVAFSSDPVFSERGIACERLRLGGTLDMGGTCTHTCYIRYRPNGKRKQEVFSVRPGDRFLIDHKTQRLGKDLRPSFDWKWAMQLAAYRRILGDGWEKAHCISHVVPVDCDVGSCWRVWSEEDLGQAWQEFVCLLDYWWAANPAKTSTKSK